MRDLLALDDPLLPYVKTAAAQNDDALRWLCDSVRHWARREFVRRMELKEAHPELRWSSNHLEDYDDDAPLRRLSLKLVGVLVQEHVAWEDEMSLEGAHVMVGLLLPESSAWYLALRTGRCTKVAGMFIVHDIVRWPRGYEITWPAAPHPDSLSTRPTQRSIMLRQGDTMTVTRTVTAS